MPHKIYLALVIVSNYDNIGFAFEEPASPLFEPASRLE
jgi:hypothetical protein